MEFFVCGGRGDGVVTVLELGDMEKAALVSYTPLANFFFGGEMH